ncbi:MAG TPA: class I SAM-dependent methyltransferase [Terriglobales bacterium]|jgi:SAM-dependent methyltransferase|nr:class I SAM-dependent methyltransferase [Terriglobales bacterium]
MPKPPTARFSDRVEDYVRYRPGYPPEVLDLLRAECGLRPSHVVADIASGTGMFTRLLLENGNSVFAVEPNAEMREMGIRLLEPYNRLVSIAGTAEETTLGSASVDFVTAAQAAHWFDLPRARAEFARILRPEGWCVLIWNERRAETTPFLRDYEQLLLTYGTDYKEVRHERTTAIIHEFFAPALADERVFDLRQQFDYQGLAGRLLSSSYAPLEGHPSHAPMMRELQRIFRAHATDNVVEFEYNTRVYYGRLGEAS